MKYVRYQHVTNPARKGETTLENWNKKAKETNLLLHWKKVEEFDKKSFVPDEAKEISESKVEKSK